MGQGDAVSSAPRSGVYDMTLRLAHCYVAFCCVIATVLAATNWNKGTAHAAAPGLRVLLPPPGAPPPGAPLPPSPLLLSPPPSPSPPPPALPSPPHRVPGGSLEHLQTPHGSVELVWEAPRDAAEGVLALFHGCSHSAGDFYAQSPRCAECLGLPEERRIQAAALAAQLLTVSFSSSDRARKCWSPATDGPRVAAALAALLRRHNASTLPLFALGASSGGGFAALLPQYVPHVAALEVQIMGAEPEALLATPPPEHGPYPPSRWTHMPRDANMAGFVAEALQALKGAGLDVEESRIEPLPITPHFFADRVPGVTPEASAAAEAALREAKLLDADGFLVQDPRAGGGAAWRGALGTLARGGLGGDTLAADASPVAEELNVAWASHEIVADDINATLAFFKRHAAPRAVAEDAAGEGDEVEEEAEEAPDDEGNGEDDEALMSFEDEETTEALMMEEDGETF